MWLAVRSSEATVFIKAVLDTENGDETKAMIVALQLKRRGDAGTIGDRAQHKVGFTQDVLATKRKSAAGDPLQHSSSAWEL